MKDKNSLFDQPTSLEHDKKVVLAVDQILAQNRVKTLRQRWAWFAVPAFASLLGIFFFQRSKDTDQQSFLANQFLLETDILEDFDLIADLEFLEELETLEEWDGSEET